MPKLSCNFILPFKRFECTSGCTSTGFPILTYSYTYSYTHILSACSGRSDHHVSPCIILAAQVPLLDCNFNCDVERFGCTSRCTSTACYYGNLLLHILLHTYLFSPTHALTNPHTIHQVSACIIRDTPGVGANVCSLQSIFPLPTGGRIR